MRRAYLCPPILSTFYRVTVENVLNSCTSIWFGSSRVPEKKSLQRVVRIAEKISGTSLPSIQDIAHRRCLSRARNTILTIQTAIIHLIDVNHQSILPSDYILFYCFAYCTFCTTKVRVCFPLKQSFVFELAQTQNVLFHWCNTVDIDTVLCCIDRLSVTFFPLGSYPIALFGIKTWTRGLFIQVSQQTQ